MSNAQQLEFLLKQLIDKGIITEWYKNGVSKKVIYEMLGIKE